MENYDSNFQLFQKQDSEGFTFDAGKFTLASGELIHCSPGFRQVKSILENIDELDARNDDVWLATYSKAGTHWVYEILHMLMNRSSKPAENYKQVSMIESSPNIDYLNQLSSPRILNSHMRVRYLQPPISNAQKIVHVVRNPKSIAVSYYFHTKKMKGDGYLGTLHSYLPTFLEGYYSLYGNWFEYMQEWWDFAQENNNVYFILYEDLKENPEQEIRKLAVYLGFDFDRDFISKVVKMTSFDEMKTGTGKIASCRKMTSKDATGTPNFMRKGTIQDWKNHLTVAENEMFDEIYNKEMSNYEELKARVRSSDKL